MSAVNNQAEGAPLLPLLFPHLPGKLSEMVVVGVKRHYMPCAHHYMHSWLLDLGTRGERYIHSIVALGVIQDEFSHFSYLMARRTRHLFSFLFFSI